MAKVKLSLLESDKVQEDILTKQQKEISLIYGNAYKNIDKEIKKLEGKNNISSIMRTEELRKLKTKIGREYKNSTTLVKNAIENNMETVSSSVVEANIDFAKKIGIGIEEAFNHVPQDIVRNLSSGKIYQEDWALSKALWGDDQRKLKEIDSIIAKGVALNKGTYDIAKDLEQYVNPDAKKDWEWSKVYPGTRKKIDYNAQRLARTIVHHAYQQSVIETAKPNPFIEGIKWLSAYSHRTCELCIQWANDDSYGLGPGVFPKDAVPLDHPNGLCALSAIIVQSPEEIADRLADWAMGKEDPELDKYANSLYGIEKFKIGEATKAVKEAKEVVLNKNYTSQMSEDEAMDMLYGKLEEAKLVGMDSSSDAYMLFTIEELQELKAHGINIAEEMYDFGFSKIKEKTLEQAVADINKMGVTTISKELDKDTIKVFDKFYNNYDIVQLRDELLYYQKQGQFDTTAGADPTKSVVKNIKYLEKKLSQVDKKGVTFKDLELAKKKMPTSIKGFKKQEVIYKKDWEKLTPEQLIKKHNLKNFEISSQWSKEDADKTIQLFDELMTKFPTSDKFTGMSIGKAHSSRVNASTIIRENNKEIVLNQTKFTTLDKAKEVAKNSRAIGWHPPGSEDYRFTFTHEYGHVISDDLEKKKGGIYYDEIINLHNSLKSSEIKKEVSKYATTNEKEFFAETFAEYIHSDNPRPIALRVGQLVEEAYK